MVCKQGIPGGIGREKNSGNLSKKNYCCHRTYHILLLKLCCEYYMYIDMVSHVHAWLIPQKQ